MAGRGAWTTKGHETGLRPYAYVAGKPLDGSRPGTDGDHRAVMLAVLAIQRDCNARGLSSLTLDGRFGAKTETAVKALQKTLGRPQTGRFDYETARRWVRPFIVAAAGTAHVPAALLYGQTSLESSFDPGARGFVSEMDSGLVQINLTAHSDVSWEQAFSPQFALAWSASRFAASMVRYKSKPALQLDCAIAQHNSPASANEWFKSGTAPTKKIADYVKSVYVRASEF